MGKEIKGQRVSVMLGDEILEKVTVSANRLGISRSAYLAFVIGNHESSREKVQNELLSNPEQFSKLLERFEELVPTKAKVTK